jgi:catechol-2,3-dioxygenase
MIKPAFHHVNLKTTRLQEMIDWYGVVVGATVNSQSNNIAFISNDRTHHRIALLAIPGLRDDPEKIVHTGIHQIRLLRRPDVVLRASERSRNRTRVLPQSRGGDILLLC